MTATKIPTLQGVDNFRDYGGYHTRPGGTVQRGLLFRSGHHARATDEDLKEMAALGVAVVVDLRRRTERVREVSRRPPGFKADLIENDIGDVGTAPHLAFIEKTELTTDTVAAFMIEEYRRIPFEPRHLDLFRRYFRAAAEGQGAILIHCAAGKDRTGLLAALTHRVLGVSDEDIMADYIETNSAARIERRAPESQENLHRLTGRRPSLEAVKAFLGVRPDYLLAAFEEIEAGAGGLDAYLERTLGVDAHMRAKLRSRLIR